MFDVSQYQDIRSRVSIPFYRTFWSRW